MNKKRQKSLFSTKNILFYAMLIACCGMGTGSKETSKPPEAGFVELEEGAGFFNGTLKDNGSTISLTEISFSGKTTIKGILDENSDSRTTIDLSKIKKIEIITPNYTSTRYPGKYYSLVKIITWKGNTIEKLLKIFPSNLSIGGRSKDGMGMGWFIKDINSITFDTLSAATTPPAPTDEKTQASNVDDRKSVITKVKEAGTAVASQVVSTVKRVGGAVTGAIASGVKKAGEYLKPGEKVKPSDTDQ